VKEWMTEEIEKTSIHEHDYAPLERKLSVSTQSALKPLIKKKKRSWIDAIRNLQTKLASATDFENQKIVSSYDPPRQTKKISLDNLSLPQHVRQVLMREREQVLSGSRSGGGATGSNVSQATSDLPQTFPTEETTSDSLNPFAYRVYRFLPGLTGRGEPIQQVPSDLLTLHPMVVGPPDYSLETSAPDLSKLLPIGHNGAICFEVIDGYIVDQSGADFAIFENPFVFHGPDGSEVYAETAVVSVAEIDDPAEYRLFPCDSTNPPYTGCAGVIPVRYSSNVPLDQVGGDLYDLSDVGLPRAKYVCIEDTGDNVSFAEGTEGFDLDSMAIIHGAR